MRRPLRPSTGRLAAALLLSIALTAGCALLVSRSPREPSFAYPDTQQTALGREVARLTAGHDGQSGFRLLSDGVAAFTARVALLRAAERSADLQYYFWRDDRLGRLLAAEALRAADRGVRVRILLDDVYVGAPDDLLEDLRGHPHVHIRSFNPLSLWPFWSLDWLFSSARANRRMHNKAFVVDGQVAIVGGRNIGDEYFEAHEEVRFDDMDVLAVGPVVAQVATAFDRYWNNELAVPLRDLQGAEKPGALVTARRLAQAQEDALRDSPYGRAPPAETLLAGVPALQWGVAQALYDDPEKVLHSPDDTRTHLLTKARPLIGGVQSELMLITPYYVPGSAGVEAMRRLVQRGVRVRVLTNSLASTDILLTYAGYMPYRLGLLRAGVELYEAKPFSPRPPRRDAWLRFASRSRLHTKLYVIDRRRLVVGSLNLDARSMRLNTELMILLESPALARSVTDWWDAHIATVAYRLELIEPPDTEHPPYGIRWVGRPDGPDGPVQRWLVEPETGFWTRFGAALLSLLPIEDQL